MTVVSTNSILRETQQSGLSSCNQNGVRYAGENHDQCQNRRAAIPDLIGYGEHNASQNEMHQCSGFPFRELEKSNHQSYEAGHRYNIKKSRHLFKDTSSRENALNSKRIA